MVSAGFYAIRRRVAMREGMAFAISNIKLQIADSNSLNPKAPVQGFTATTF
jgi:hypothetical protein